MRRDQASFEQFLNNLEGEVVSVIPNVSPSYTWGGMGAKVRYLWVIEKMNLWKVIWLNKIEDIRQNRKRAHKRLLALKSKVYKKFLELEKITYSDGALKKKDKELIAIGIAIVIDCESCIEWHVTEAAKSGATVQEILEAIEVGIEFGGGPATVTARFALDVIDTIFT